MLRTSETASGSLGAIAIRLLARLVVGIAALFRAFEHRREIRRLAELDERMLKDIGLTRSDVIGALGQPLYKDPGTAFIVRSVARRARSRRLAVTAEARPDRTRLTPPARAGA